MSLRDAWEHQAEQWADWARAPGHDAYWKFHGERFFEIVPDPGRLTVDVGCGEGRVGRDLIRRGHRVVAVDASPTLVGLAASHEEPLPVVLADACALPIPDDVADLAVAFMSPQDIDDVDAAFGEASRVLTAGGRLCLAVVHPVNSAGAFAGERDDTDAPFVIERDYFEPRRYAEEAESRGHTMVFHSEHRSLEAYSRALEDAGFLVEAIREVTTDDPSDRWHRVPLFLHVRAVLGP